MEMLVDPLSCKTHAFEYEDPSLDCTVPYQAWDSTLFQLEQPQVETSTASSLFPFEALSQTGSPSGVTNEPFLWSPSFFKEMKKPLAATIHPLSCQPYIRKCSKTHRSPAAKNRWNEEVEHMLSGTLMDIFKDVKESPYFNGLLSKKDQLNHDSDITRYVTSETSVGVPIGALQSSFSTHGAPYSTFMSGGSNNNSTSSKIGGPSNIFQPEQLMESLLDQSSLMEYSAHTSLEASFPESVKDPFSNMTTLNNTTNGEVLVSSPKRGGCVADIKAGESATHGNKQEALSSQTVYSHSDDSGQHKCKLMLQTEGDKVPDQHGVDLAKAVVYPLSSSPRENHISSGTQFCPPQPTFRADYHSRTHYNGLYATYTTAQNKGNKSVDRYMNARQWDNTHSHESSQASQCSQEVNLNASIGNSQFLVLNTSHACEQVGMRFANGYTEIGLVHLLTAGAEAVARRDMDLASAILARLKDMVSHSGNTLQRVATYFIQGLQRQADGGTHLLPGNVKSQGDILAAFQIFHEIFPYIKFGHFTANQAILEAVQEERRVRIVDFEIMEGIQWPAFMQALVSRKGGPPELHITALCRPHWGHELALAQKTGKRLSEFASALNLPFIFSLLKVDTQDGFNPNSLKLIDGETLVVNCMVHLPHMPRRPVAWIGSFLRDMHKLSPRALTLVEEQLGCSTVAVASYFSDALHHFHAISDSLEACLPTEVEARMLVERVFMAPRIDSAIAIWSGTFSLCWQHGAADASSKYGWSTLTHAAGFRSVPLSSHNRSQARLLLGLHGDGFNLEERSHSLVLGWRSKPLFSASVWN